MADFLTQKRTEIDERLRELRPLYEEFQKLERAKAALAGVDAPKQRATRSRSGGGGGAGRRRGRRGGTTERALETIRQNPGITVADLARRLDMKHPNYLYRVLPSLESQGAVKREGKGWAAA